jgi:peptide-methionine (R)-S-oxide reductase/peptide methionine sulfoxide reductase msrA/msrB
MRSFFKPSMLSVLAIAATALIGLACHGEPTGSAAATTRPTAEQLATYKATLSANTYHIMFEAGTEPPFDNAYHNNHAEGTYISAATGVPLFSSDDKYDSGTGWPSFVKPITPDAVVMKTDPDGDRTEVIDASSGGHLGHVFDDGPEDRGGKRFCMNSAALKFVPKGEKLPTTMPAK